MVNIKDFTVGGVTRWDDYRKAKQNAGEICFNCGRNLVLNREIKGSSDKFNKTLECRTLCSSCRELQTFAGNITNTKYIRCPRCKNTFEPIEFLDFDIYEDGEHDLDCPRCKHFFIVETTVSYSYESPAFVENPPEEDC